MDWVGSRRSLTARPEAKARADQWSCHLQVYLRAGGIMGDEAGPEKGSTSRVPKAFSPIFPQADERFESQWNFVFPPHEVARLDGVPADEKTLALIVANGPWKWMYPKSWRG